MSDGDRRAGGGASEPVSEAASSGFGSSFVKDPEPAIDIDRDFPDNRVLCPNVVPLESGGYRLYFMEHHADCPRGVHGEIRSAISEDGKTWQREPAVRIGARNESIARVLAPDIVVLPAGWLRMYFEERRKDGRAGIASAVSQDGFDWEIEEGVRIVDPTGQASYGTPCCVALPDGHWRLYFYSRKEPQPYHILSAVSENGLAWELEPGVRIPQTTALDGYGVYAPHVIERGGRGWRMLYSAWSSKPDMHGRIMTALSEDGLAWTKSPDPVIDCGGRYDRAHCSEPCLARLSDGRWRLYYEACGADGRWRILSATSEVSGS